MDFREFHAEIKELVRGVNLNDPNWKWKLNKVCKERAFIEWGYLNYLNEAKNCFFIQYSNDAECLATYTPNEELIDIADTLEEAVLQIAHYAHSRY